ncbi:hypothetical protein FCL40_13055 [Ferrimonas sediminicola]|uniref:Uncharacterized protein n=1 Tax=Ferrimonas sediminicola TaxID=2569538 RepID=A0A4U1BC90_9GAMM|nr:hypothetical protein [Ferrimonas sediminicola]TKB48273.1 hypothetical protein FCL40_13055 [Ferrimonas sediminicola]
MRLGILGLSALLALVGCGEPEATWVHDTKDNQAFMADRDSCNRRTDDSQANFKERFAVCMQAAGWRLESH